MIVLGKLKFMPDPVMKTTTTQIDVRVHTTDMRVYGIMHVLPQSEISSVLNNNRLFFPMTHCKVYKRGLRHPPKQENLQFEPEFLAVPKEKVIWLDTGEKTKVFAPAVQLRSLYLFFGAYLLKGDFLILPSVRTSDFLVRAVIEKPFQYFFNAQLCLPVAGKPLKEAKVVEQFTVITVNLKNVAGVFDLEQDDLTDFGDL